LADWLKNSWLVEHESSVEEIAALLAIVERDLANATLAGWAFGGLEAQHCLQRRAASRYGGTRCGGLPRRTRAAPLSDYTKSCAYHPLASHQDCRWPVTKIARFDRFRKKRNIGGYEIAGVVSGPEAREMHELATGLRGDVVAWLRKHHPRLLTE
jgi:hypothetical protein